MDIKYYYFQKAQKETREAEVTRKLKFDNVNYGVIAIDSYKSKEKSNDDKAV